MSNATDRPPAGSPALKPLDVDGVSATLTGTIAWVVALLVLAIFFRDALAAHEATWWLWVCVAGIVLGLMGLTYVLRRRAAYRTAEQAAK